MYADQYPTTSEPHSPADPGVYRSASGRMSAALCAYPALPEIRRVGNVYVVVACDRVAMRHVPLSYVEHVDGHRAVYPLAHDDHDQDGELDPGEPVRISLPTVGPIRSASVSEVEWCAKRTYAGVERFVRRHMYGIPASNELEAG